MVKFEIAGEQKEKEKVVTLKLIYTNGGVILTSQEEGHYLLRFNGEGSITRYAGVPSHLGFKLDASGRIVVE